MLRSSANLSEARSFICDTRRVLSMVGFNLTKFVVNDSALQAEIAVPDRAEQVAEITSEAVSKALGTCWDEPGLGSLADKWLSWLASLSDLSSLRLSRCLVPESFVDGEAELIRISDASQAGYGVLTVRLNVLLKRRLDIEIVCSSFFTDSAIARSSTQNEIKRFNVFANLFYYFIWKLLKTTCSCHTLTFRWRNHANWVIHIV